MPVILMSLTLFNCVEVHAIAAVFWAAKDWGIPMPLANIVAGRRFTPNANLRICDTHRASA